MATLNGKTIQVGGTIWMGQLSSQYPGGWEAMNNDKVLLFDERGAYVVQDGDRISIFPRANTLSVSDVDKHHPVLPLSDNAALQRLRPRRPAPATPLNPLPDDKKIPEFMPETSAPVGNAGGIGDLPIEKPHGLRSWFETTEKFLQGIAGRWMDLAPNETHVTGNSRVKSVAFHPSMPSYLLVALHTGVVQVWDVECGALLHCLNVTRLPLRALRVLPGSATFVCGGDDPRLFVYDFASLSRTVAFSAHRDFIRGIELHPTRQLALTCSDDTSVALWDLSDTTVPRWRLVRSFIGHTRHVMATAWCATSHLFVSASLDGTVLLWNIEATETPPLATLRVGSPVLAVACHPLDPAIIVTVSEDRRVSVWDTTEQNACAVAQDLAPSSDHQPSALRFHQDLSILAVGGENVVYLWGTFCRAGAWPLLAVLPVQVGRIWDLAFGDSNIACGGDWGLEVWRIRMEGEHITVGSLSLSSVARYAPVSPDVAQEELQRLFKTAKGPLDPASMRRAQFLTSQLVNKTN
eukprot:TRINITY_DN17487_c0_g1_i1.p1 TRINITY_DN17487_c0_g1~~TRINITY_DN17487_c0_g1_i1.p1  ORF type:complete len:528 (+),score=36.56 TRINITY_DN17487_c0_g1_i1:23-1585(+)